ncbi:hypothetical protein, partial [Citrobacter youngae]|uniref:hypothetical protein n=1 Tax=Citrobacter youngae TaxID=133448 RepID=UPI001953BEB1
GRLSGIALAMGSGFQPFMSYYSIIFLSIIILTNGYAVFIKGNWDTSNFIAAYITLPPFFLE